MNDRSRPRRSPKAKKGRHKRGKGKRRRRQHHGTQWRSYKVKYRINVRASNRRKGRCLVDRRANGCIIGSDMSIVDCTNKYIDLTGIKDHMVRELNIVNAAWILKSLSVCQVKCSVGDSSLLIEVYFLANWHHQVGFYDQIWIVLYCGSLNNSKYPIFQWCSAISQAMSAFRKASKTYKAPNVGWIPAIPVLRSAI